MSRRAPGVWLGLAAGAGLCGAAHAERPELNAGLDINQLVERQLSGVGDSVTYTEFGGTVAGAVRNRRIVLTGSYRLSYRLPESGTVDENFQQDGVLRMQANVIEEWLAVDAGAIVTRSRIDPSGAASQSSGGNVKNLAETRSFFVRPSLAHRIGDFTFGANYSYAYTGNQGKSGVFSTGAITNRFSSSVDQQGRISIGMERSALPFDWTISSDYRSENSSSLDQHLRSINLFGEIRVPLTGELQLVGSSGYERTKTSQRSALVDAFGQPVLTDKGRFVVDPASPRVLTYDMSGLVGEAGLVWRPSSRTRMQIRGGRRYGGFSVTGLIEMKPSERRGLTIIVTDSIQTFSQGVSQGLASTPANINPGMSIDPGSSYEDCLFGQRPGAGNCIGGSLGQASASTYRERSISGLFVNQGRRWSFNTSFGYARRTYIDEPGTLFSLDGVVDHSIFGNVDMGTKLSPNSGVSFSFTGNLFKNGQVGASDVMSGLFSTSYYRSFGRGLRAQARFSLEASKQDGVEADISGRAQLGVQYQF